VDIQRHGQPPILHAAAMSLAIPLMIFDGRPFTRADALAAGWTDSRLSKLVRDGLIRRLMQGVYVDALAPDAAALSLVAPSDAVICRRSAAWLYGIDTLALREHTEIPTVDCVRPYGRRATRLGPSGTHSQTLRPGDVTTVLGLRVTSPVATAVHLARHLDRPFALSGVDAMLHAGLVELDELKAAVKSFAHHPGIVQARDIARYAEPLTESPGESWLRLRMLDAGFPRPQAQVVVHGKFRLDLGFPEPGPDGMRVGLEYDSDLWHSGHAADLRDSSRRAELRPLGWHILPVRRGDVWGRRPDLERAVGDLLGIQPLLPRQW
jgi:putative AbiEi antitoxin of type IV toxin-antitoxin system